MPVLYTVKEGHWVISDLKLLSLLLLLLLSLLLYYYYYIIIIIIIIIPMSKISKF